MAVKKKEEKENPGQRESGLGLAIKEAYGREVAREAVQRGAMHISIHSPKKPSGEGYEKKTVPQRVDEAFEKLNLERTPENQEILSELCRRGTEITPVMIEKAHILRGYGLGPTRENFERLVLLKEYDIAINAETIMLSTKELKDFNNELTPLRYFIPRIDLILGTSTVESRRSVSQRPVGLSPEKKDEELEHLKMLADLAPERMGKVLAGMKISPFHKDKMEAFLKTEYGKKFEDYLKEKLQTKGETDGKDSEG